MKVVVSLLALAMHLQICSAQAANEFKSFDQAKKYKGIAFETKQAECNRLMQLKVFKQSENFGIYSIQNKAYLQIGDFKFEHGTAFFSAAVLSSVALEIPADQKYYDKLTSYLTSTYGVPKINEFNISEWAGKNISYRILKNTETNHFDLQVWPKD